MYAMSTELQKKLAQNIVQNIVVNKPKNKKELVASSGYSEVSADKHATEIIRQKGVQKELKELGFSIENAKRIVGHILNSPIVYEMVTPENQLRAAQEVFKVTGEYENEGDSNKTLIINITGETAERYGIKPRTNTSLQSEDSSTG